MKEPITDPVDQPDDTSGAPDKKDSVAFDTYQKLLKEKKAKDSKLSEYEKELEKLRVEKLEAEGKKDELLASFKKQLQETQEKLKQKDQTYAWSTLTGEVKREAMRIGCKDPDKLIRLLSDDDLRAIEVGDDFKINQESLKEVLERSKKDNYFLFESSTKNAAAGTPGKKPPEEPEKKLAEMTLQELKESYKKSYKK